MKLRVGNIGFLNSYPILYGLQKACPGEFMLLQGMPTELNRKLCRNELDISAISSIEYARNRDLFLLPELSISSDGPVQSIFLISKLPVKKLNGQTISLPDTSATSIALLKIILEKQYGLEVNYEILSPHLTKMLEENQAALLIGDHALEASYHRVKDYWYYDLGQEWKAFCGKKMVYAVWAARKELCLRAPEVVKKINQVLQFSLEYSFQHFAQMLDSLCSQYKYEKGFLARYFLGLEYTLTKEHQDGLAYFLHLATKQMPQIHFFGGGAGETLIRSGGTQTLSRG